MHRDKENFVGKQALEGTNRTELLLSGVKVQDYAPERDNRLLNDDGIVNGADLAICLLFWGPCTGNCPADFNADEIVNGADLSMILSAWGPCS